MEPRRFAILLAAVAAALLIAVFLVPSLFDPSAPPSPPDEPPAPDPRPPGSARPTPSSSPSSPNSAAPSEGGAPAAAPPPAAGGRARGRVVDLAGDPVPAAIVYRIAAHEDSIDGERADEMPTTSPSGRFSFAVEADAVTDIGVMKAGFAPVLLLDVALSGSGETDLGDVVLGAGAEVSGCVTGPGGEPAARLAVRALPVSESGEAVEWSARTKGGMISLPGRSLLATRPADALTAADGSYAIRGLAAGASYRVEPASPGGSSLSVTVVAPAAHVDFVLAPTGVIVVRSLDAATGEPLGGARVSLRGPRNTMRQSPDWSKEPARFEEEIVLGEYEVESAVRGYANAAERVVLEDAASPLEVTLRLEKASEAAFGAIRVVARDDAGKPIPQVCLAVRAEDGALSEANPGRGTDETSGTRVIERLRPGRVEVAVTSQSRDFGQVETEAEIVAGETTALEVTVPRAGRLAVDVRDAAGASVSGYSLDVLDAAGGRIPAEISVKSGVFSTMSYGPGDVIGYPGRLRVARLPAGEATLVFGGEKFASERVTATVKAGEEVAVTVTLRRVE